MRSGGAGGGRPLKLEPDHFFAIHRSGGVLRRILQPHERIVKKLSGGSFFPIFGPWSPEFISLDLRFGFYARFQPRGKADHCFVVLKFQKSVVFNLFLG